MGCRGRREDDEGRSRGLPVCEIECRDRVKPSTEGNCTKEYRDDDS